MKLITVEATVASGDATTSAALFEGHAPTVRDMAGCESYDLYADTNGGGKFVIVQRWFSMEDFDAYRQSDVFAQLGQGLKPMMTSVPVTTVCMVES